MCPLLNYNDKLRILNSADVHRVIVLQILILKGNEIFKGINCSADDFKIASIEIDLISIFGVGTYKSKDKVKIPQLNLPPPVLHNRWELLCILYLEVLILIFNMDAVKFED